MTAPQSVVDAEMVALRCRLMPTGLPRWRCLTHDCPNVPHRGCAVAVEAADAAWAAAYPAALRDAAERVERGIPHHGMNVHSAYASDLRRWADESEA